MGTQDVLLTGHGRTEIGDIVLDATVSESHSHSAESVTSPVESGLEIEDHTRQNPDQLTIEGMWTDTPQGSTSAELNRSQEQYERLLNLKERGAELDVVTGLKVYENMVIQNIDTTRDTSTGFTVPVSISLQEKRRVSQLIEDIPPPAETASPETRHSARETTERGQQKSEPPDEETEEKTERTGSFLHDWVG